MGLNNTSKTSLDAGAGGPIMNKSEDEIEGIIEEIVDNYATWQEGERAPPRQAKGTIHSLAEGEVFEKLLEGIKAIVEKSLEKGGISSSQAAPPTLLKGQGKSKP